MGENHCSLQMRIGLVTFHYGTYMDFPLIVGIFFWVALRTEMQVERVEWRDK